MQEMYNCLMDDFEREYFEKLRKLALGFGNKRRELAKSRIKMFAAAVARQILSEKIEFDLIIGGGNSGLFMTKITELVYEILGKKSPKVLNIPIIRIIEENKEARALHDLISELNIEKIEKVLFVDDEIMRSVTAKTCLELILAAKPEIQHIDATIIAENHFFEWHYSLPKVSIRFFAYSRLIQWLNGNIGYFIPENLFKKIQEDLPEVKNYNHAMAIVIGNGIKKLENGKPYFDFNVKVKLKNYKEQKEELIRELKFLISETIRQYKEGKIKFRF